MNWPRPTSRFVRQVLTLISGTVVAQAIPVLIAPLLVRLYGPDDFGLLALYVAVTGTLSVASTAGYPLAITLPDDDKDAINLLGVSLAMGIVFSLGSLLLIVILREPIRSLLGSRWHGPSVFVVPAGLLVGGFYNSLHYWLNRCRRYRRLAAGKITQSAMLATVATGLGFAGIGSSAGLIAGHLAGQTAAVCLFATCFWKPGGEPLSRLTPAGMWRQARRYRDFPKYSAPAGTVNACASQLPVILMTAYFGPTVVGFYSLTQRVLGAPIALVAAAVADVFKQTASREYAAEGHCRRTFSGTFWLLAALGVLPFGLLVLGAPWLFALVFGAEWRTAGTFAQIMAGLFFLRFVAGPLSRVAFVAEKQPYDLIWQIVLAALTISSIVAGGLVGSPVLAVSLFTAVYSLMYLVSLLMSYRFAQGLEHAVRELRRSPFQAEEGDADGNPRLSPAASRPPDRMSA